MKRVLFALLLCFATVLSISAQQTKVGTISGRIVDVSGAAIGSANVFVHNRTWPDDMKLAIRTDKNGGFHLGLPEGIYDILVVSPGFFAQAETVPVWSGKVKVIAWRMKILPCDFPSMNCDTFFDEPNLRTKPHS